MSMLFCCLDNPVSGPFLITFPALHFFEAFGRFGPGLAVRWSTPPSRRPGSCSESTAGMKPTLAPLRYSPPPNHGGTLAESPPGEARPPHPIRRAITDPLDPPRGRPPGVARGLVVPRPPWRPPDAPRRPGPPRSPHHDAGGVLRRGAFRVRRHCRRVEHRPDHPPRSRGPPVGSPPPPGLQSSAPARTRVHPAFGGPRSGPERMRGLVRRAPSLGPSRPARPRDPATRQPRPRTPPTGPRQPAPIPRCLAHFRGRPATGGSPPGHRGPGSAHPGAARGRGLRRKALRCGRGRGRENEASQPDPLAGAADQ